MIARLDSPAGWTVAVVEIRQDDMAVRVGAIEMSAGIHRLANRERDGIGTLVELAGRAAREGVFLRCCAGCRRFGFSGLSFQFSGGTRGYCARAGRRDPDLTVGIDFGCGEHEPIEGWPDDQPTMDRVRLELRMSDPFPSRLGAFEGGVVGLVTAASRASEMPADFVRDAARVTQAIAERSEQDATALVTDRMALCDRDLPGVGAVVAGTAIGLMHWREPTTAIEQTRALIAASGRPQDASADAVAMLVAMAMRKRPVNELRRVLAELGGTRGAAIERGLECFAGSPEVFGDMSVQSENALAAAVAGALGGSFNGVGSIPDSWRSTESGTAALTESAMLLNRAGTTR